MKCSLQLRLVMASFAIWGAARGTAQDDVVVTGRRPVLTAGSWKIEEGLWRSGGWQARHGRRTLFYCVGKYEIEKLLMVMMGGRDNERPPQCGKVTISLRKQKIVAKWKCIDTYTRDVTLTALTNPDVIDAEIELRQHGNGSQDKGNHYFRRTSRAQYIAACPLQG